MRAHALDTTGGRNSVLLTQDTTGREILAGVERARLRSDVNDAQAGDRPMAANASCGTAVSSRETRRAQPRCTLSSCANASNIDSARSVRSVKSSERARSRARFVSSHWWTALVSCSDSFLGHP